MEESSQANQQTLRGKRGSEADATMTPVSQNIPNPDLYINRELSLLEFHARVLDEAEDEHNLLLERLKFLAIFNSNLDEFFMIRLAAIKEKVKEGVSEKSIDGLMPTEEMAVIVERALQLLERQAHFFRDKLQPALAKHGIKITGYKDLTPQQREAANHYFEQVVFPVCTPLAVDPGHPFPHISNLSLNLAVELQDPDGRRLFARVKVPNVLPRLVTLSASNSQNATARGNTDANARRGSQGEGHVYLWLEELLAANLEALFPQMQLLETHPFKVIRDADLEIEELQAANLLTTVEQSLSRSRFGSPVALFVNPSMPENIRTLLADNLELETSDIYVTQGPLGLSNLFELYQIDMPQLKEHTFAPRIPPPFRSSSSIFTAIQQGDILLHHPFDSFSPVLDFIREAAYDKAVLAIKQTLYRVGSHSPIVESLREAAEAGKQVAVLVEVKARGDEENNIEWARALEQAGVHVTYGLLGLKTHCKVALVVRKEASGIRRYVHLGTGNYNQTTARLYTDMGLFTCRPEFGADASELFNYLTGYSKQSRYRKLLVAPVTLRSGIVERIEREANRQEEHGDGRIIFKVNHLVDPTTINALYRASQKGVKIDLIVRSMCSVRPGVPGVSENIRVLRVVGRFLEHSRIYYFRNGGKEEVFMGSADIMERNLDRRIEALFPVEDENIRSYLLHEILEAYLRDTAKASILQRDGTYVRRTAEGEKSGGFDIQAHFVSQVVREANTGGAITSSLLPSFLGKFRRQDGGKRKHGRSHD